MTGRWGADWVRIVCLGGLKFVIALAVFAAAERFSSRALSSTDPMPLWLVLGATAIVAMTFWLLRESLRRLVDRVLLGERADGYEAGRALLQRMSSTLPVDEIVPALAETAGRTTHSARAEVRLLLPDGGLWSQVWPQRATADGSPVTAKVRHAGTAVGEIEIDIADLQESPRDRMLLDDLARPAGLALSTVRLTLELRRRAVELEDLTAVLAQSYRRIADARRSEAARIRTEMQDRVMPYLDLAQAAISDQLNGDAQPNAASIDTARDEVAQALESLRVLARGIYPPRLADAGLAVSLEGWQQRSGIPIDLAIRGDEGVLHANTELESCLYFCLVTAFGEFAADGEHPSATLDVGATSVNMTMTGLVESESLGQTSAMTAVRDRVEAFGGRFEVAVESLSQAPAGTLLDPAADLEPRGRVMAIQRRATLHGWVPLFDPRARAAIAARAVNEERTDQP